MSRKVLAMSLFVLSIPLAGCLTGDTGDTDLASDCPISDAKDVKVWINGMPGTSGPTMIVLFSALTPTPGYSIEGKIVSVTEIAPPIYEIDVIATPPAGIVLQVVTRSDVRLEIPVQESEARAVDLRCGGETLFYVEDVQTVF